MMSGRRRTRLKTSLNSAVDGALFAVTAQRQTLSPGMTPRRLCGPLLPLRPLGSHTPTHTFFGERLLLSLVERPLERISAMVVGTSSRLSSRRPPHYKVFVLLVSHKSSLFARFPLLVEGFLWKFHDYCRLRCGRHLRRVTAGRRSRHHFRYQNKHHAENEKKWCRRPWY